MVLTLPGAHYLSLYPAPRLSSPMERRSRVSVMGRGKQPWVKFWYSDWIGDLDVQGASLQARGAWLQVLCSMWHFGLYEMTFTWEELAAVLRCDMSVTQRVTQEIKTSEIAEVSISETCVTFLSRRLEREAKYKENNRQRQERFRRNAGITPKVTPRITPQITGRSLEAEKLREETPIVPLKGDGEFKTFWQAYPRHAGIGAARKAFLFAHCERKSEHR